MERKLEVACGLISKVDIAEKHKIVTKNFSGVPFPNPDIEIYTDGSKMDSGVGFGVLIIQGELRKTHSAKLADANTVFQAELCGVKESGFQLIRDKTQNKVINLYSDSSAALAAIASIDSSCALARATKHVWNYLGSNNKVSLSWVKAHAGLEGNVIADDLAKAGTTGALSVIEPGLSQNWVKKTVKQFYKVKWQTDWDSTESYRQTRDFFPNVGDDHADILDQPRQVTGKICRFCSGFNHLNYHSHNKNHFISKKCRLCQDGDETAWHLVAECDSTANLRRLHLPRIEQGFWTAQGMRAFLSHPKLISVTENRTTT